MQPLRWMILAGLFTRSVALFADSEPTPVQLRYEVGAGCPPADTFVEGFQARTKRFALTTGPASSRRTIRVVVDDEPQHSHGRLEIRSGESIIATREVEGPTCDEVVSVLAFVAALASEGGPALSSPNPAQSIAAPSPPSPSSLAPALPKTTWQRRASAGAQGTALLGAFPQVAPDFAVFMDIRRVRTMEALPEDIVDGLGPSFRVSLRGAQSGSSPVRSGGEAKFQRFSAAFSGCPWWVRLGKQWSVVPCATAEVGVFTAEAYGITLTRPPQVGLWAALGTEAWLRWELLPPFFVEAVAQLQMPLRRDHFFVAIQGEDPRNDAWRVSPVCGAAGLGMGFEL
jgi:hypothetical protein